MAAHDPIPLILAQNTAFVWDVDDMATLRTKHGICGVLSGTLPHLSQQNVFLGVPLILMPEEVVYLVQKEIAVLIDDPAAYSTPSNFDLTSWITAQEESVEHQLSIAQMKERKERLAPGRAMSEEASRKRREREERNTRAISETTNGGTEPRSTFTSALSTAQAPISSAAAGYTVLIPTESNKLPWYQPSNERCVYTLLADAKEKGIWTFPSTLHECARCSIFRDLREKGYYIGGGIKFGGEYLVYPGDPLRYHSHFVASVHESPVSTLHPMEVVAHGRLGTATKKAHLLCGWDDETKEVSYLSIEWGGFG